MHNIYLLYLKYVLNDSFIYLFHFLLDFHVIGSCTFHLEIVWRVAMDCARAYKLLHNLLTMESVSLPQAFRDHFSSCSPEERNQILMYVISPWSTSDKKNLLVALSDYINSSKHQEIPGNNLRSYVDYVPDIEVSNEEITKITSELELFNLKDLSNSENTASQWLSNDTESYTFGKKNTPLSP